jgi:predicted metal-binding protein
MKAKKPASAIQKDLKKLESFARKKGATAAKAIAIDDIVTDERVYYKCRYGCPSYDSSKMCPPHTPHPNDFERALRKYRYGLLVQTRPSDINEMVVMIERQAFLQGYYLALGLRGGPCILCDECTEPDDVCRNPEMARPAMEAVGIDVFATLENAGISAEIKKSGEEEWFYHGLILVD